MSSFAKLYCYTHVVISSSNLIPFFISFLPLSSCLTSYLFSGNDPLSRYVSVNTVTNLETQYTFNLLANFTGVVNDTIDTCKKCEKENSDSNQV